MLSHPAVERGRSPSWHDAQVEGVLPPCRWNLPPVQLAVLAWHETQSASAAAAVWSNWIPGGSAAPAEVSTAAGRLLAWQSMHGDGGAASDAWYAAGAAPERPTAQLAAPCAGGRWHWAQSSATSGVVPGFPSDQATASCLISAEGGVRAGFVAAGPTNPAGAAPAWQSTQAEGCTPPSAVSDAWKTPG